MYSLLQFLKEFSKFVILRERRDRRIQTLHCAQADLGEMLLY